MRQLSALDTAFLDGDNTHANANVTLIHIYDQTTAPGGTVRFKRILAQIESRLDRLPLFRQKLHPVPLALERPYWVDDGNFDLEYHVHHTALPKPGDWRQFCIQVARIHARPLARDRPLWEIHVVEGLDGFVDLPPGSFALLTKTHHAALDAGGHEITQLLHDPSPLPVRSPPPPPWFPEPAPGPLALLAGGVARTVGAPLRLAAPVAAAVRRALPAACALAADLARRPAATLPPTRFNAVVSPHRVFETRRFRLAEFAAIAALVPGATVDDAVLTVCGGALALYLDGLGEGAAGPLTAMTPSPAGLDAAGGADAAAAALAAGLRVPLATDVDDPVERLAAVHAFTAAAGLSSGGAGVQPAASAGNPRAAAATLAMSARWLGASAAGRGRRMPLASCSIAHVPGPAQPVYLCGARMTYTSAIMPIADGMGLVFAVTSYEEQLIVSPTSCRELMPDPVVFAQCLRDSFQALLARAVDAGLTTAAAAAPGARAGRATARAARRAVADTAAAALAAAAAVKPPRRRASSAGTPARPSPTGRTVAKRPRAARAGRPAPPAPSR